MQPEQQIAAFNLVVIRAADIDSSAVFYSLLGMKFVKHRHGSGPEHYACEQQGIIFEIYPRQNENDSTSALRMGFRVGSVDDSIERLREAGTRIVSMPKNSEWGRRAVVEDPDGHRVELVSQAQEG